MAKAIAKAVPVPKAKTPTVPPPKTAPGKGRSKGLFKYTKTDRLRGQRQSTIFTNFDPGREARKAAELEQLRAEQEDIARRERQMAIEGVVGRVAAGLVERTATAVTRNKALWPEWAVEKVVFRTGAGTCIMCEKPTGAARKEARAKGGRTSNRVVLMQSGVGLYLRSMCGWPSFGWCGAKSIDGVPTPCTEQKISPQHSRFGLAGGDREALMSCTADAGTYAVIAPNMAKQIVALQAALQQMATDFPGSFDGYSLSVIESHQATKADTSGTAKAISASLAQLTGESDFTPERIQRVREQSQQLAGGGPSHSGVSPVSEDALDGHAFHTYSLLSADKNVEFQIRHNVEGRSTYAEGTVDAALFLARRIGAGAEKRVYDMIDVLRAGAM